MSRKNFIFTLGLLSLVFTIAMFIIFYLYNSKIEQNRVYYEERLKELELEVEKNIKYKK